MIYRSRHWFQFTLRTLFVILTVAAFGLGRIEYLRRFATFHNRQAEGHILNLQQTKHLQRSEVENMLQFHGVFRSYLENEFGDDYRKAYYHRILSEEYQKAVFRPWTIVDESPPGWEDVGNPNL